MKSFPLKTLAVSICCVLLVVAQAFRTDENKDEKAKNLTVLPKDMTGEQIHQEMRMYSKALGVRCNHCHEVQMVEGQKPKIDFASDKNPKKDVCRRMIQMTDSINKKFVSRIIGDHPFEAVTCVTCHMGRTKPVVSADSLAKK